MMISITFCYLYMVSQHYIWILSDEKHYHESWVLKVKTIHSRLDFARWSLDLDYNLQSRVSKPGSGGPLFCRV